MKENAVNSSDQNKIMTLEPTVTVKKKILLNKNSLKIALALIGARKRIKGKND